MLKVGDYVMKTVEGVCRVDEELMLKAFGSSVEVPFYMLIPIKDQQCRVYIQASENYEGIRPVMSEQEARAFIGRIPSIDATDVENDRKREQIYKEAIRSLNPDRIVSVIKTMLVHSEERVRQGKKKTSLDDRYFKIAEDVLFQELGFVLKKDAEGIRALIGAASKKA